MLDKIKQSVISFAITGLHVYLTIVVIEWIYRGSINGSYLWLKEFTKPFTYNFIILFLLFSVLRIFRRKLYILFSFLLTVSFIILAIASRTKLEIRGEPVLPSDLFLGSEVTNMLEFFSESLLTWIISGVLVVIALLAFMVYKLPNQKNRNWLQISLAGFFFLSFIVFYQYETKHEVTFLKKNLHVINFAWDQKETTRQDGIIASFFLNMKWLTIESPENYSKQTVEKIISETDAPSYSDSEKPNVVVIMSEAFWDPTVLENVEFNQDPLPYFHQLQKETSAGRLTVPVFGGSTANTEFEALTGVATQFLPVGSIPYLNYIKKPLPALPNIFREHGYESTAIHTFHHWFYQRSSVYEDLGFDRFVSLEYIPEPVPDSAGFIQDKTITDEVLRKINMGNKPNFIFAVTTQNHGPYATVGKKEYASIEVELNKDEGFSPEAENILEVYSDNLAEIDKELKRLITELEKTNKKTIVVFFGDHLPLLGSDYQVYREAGYYNEESNDYEEYLDMYSTPLLIWDNFSGKKEDLQIGSSLLAPVILDRAGLEGNYLTDFLMDQYNNKNNLRKITRSDFLEKENIKDQVISDIKLLQHDLLFGDMYGIKDKKKIKPSPDYRLGYNDPKISKISIETIDGKRILRVKGKNFTSRSYVYVNDEYIPRESGDENEIVVLLPKKADDFKVVVKVIDSNEKVLSQSNLVEVKK